MCTLLGTDVASAARYETNYIVSPSEQNRLMKETSFALKPQYFRIRDWVKIQDKFIGRLDPPDLQQMQFELVRLFGEEE